MRVERINPLEIQYQECAYSLSLKESLIRIGVSFPIRVRKTEQGYECIDGHKRLSCIHDMMRENPAFAKTQTIPVILEHHERSAPPMHLRNHH